MKTKKDYKVGDKVMVVSNNKICCSECSNIAEWFEEHKPVGIIRHIGTFAADIDFDEQQDIYGDGSPVGLWIAQYEYIQPAGPQVGEQLTFVFTGPDIRADKEVDKPKTKTKKKPKWKPQQQAIDWDTVKDGDVIKVTSPTERSIYYGNNTSTSTTDLW